MWILKVTVKSIIFVYLNTVGGGDKICLSVPKTDGYLCFAPSVVSANGIHRVNGKLSQCQQLGWWQTLSNDTNIVNMFWSPRDRIAVCLQRTINNVRDRVQLVLLRIVFVYCCRIDVVPLIHRATFVHKNIAICHSASDVNHDSSV